MSFIIIYITHKNKEEAQKIAHHLLEKKLIACVNYFPIDCAYWWQGNIAQDHEIVSLCKTRNELWEQVKAEVEKNHPYDAPCIMKMDVSANDAYETWIQNETS